MNNLEKIVLHKKRYKEHFNIPLSEWLYVTKNNVYNVNAFILDNKEENTVALLFEQGVWSPKMHIHLNCFANQNAYIYRAFCKKITFQEIKKEVVEKHFYLVEGKWLKVPYDIDHPFISPSTAFTIRCSGEGYIEAPEIIKQNYLMCEKYVLIKEHRCLSLQDLKDRGYDVNLSINEKANQSKHNSIYFLRKVINK